MKSGYTCSMRTVLVVRLDDKPGALAALARKLGDAGVDVVSAIHLGTVGGHAQVALGVDNLERARSLDEPERDRRLSRFPRCVQRPFSQPITKARFLNKERAARFPRTRTARRCLAT